MSFVGEVNRLGDSYVRPHDIEVVLDADERTEEGDGADGSSPSASRSGSSSCSATAPRSGRS